MVLRHGQMVLRHGQMVRRRLWPRFFGHCRARLVRFRSWTYADGRRSP
jgi:hypothetical protein